MSTVAKKIMMGSGAVAEFEVEQSLIFNSSSLVRTPSSTGNRKKFTISVWVKRTKVGQLEYVYGGQSVNETDVYFSDSDTLNFFGYQGGALTWGWSTTRVFRDVGAWYHIVAIFDSANSTQALRARLFVNGEEQPENGATSLAVTLNQDSMMNLAGTPQYIGRLFSTGYPYYYSGYMAEFHFLDGAATVASNFGETNSDTGQWVPKKYSGGSYGTNGFYLKFVSGAIGTDSSGEGNNMTVANLANSDVVTDSPTNNFATLNPLDTIATNGTISEGNLKVVGGNYPSQIFPSTISVSSGKWYAEFTQSTTNYPMVGVSDSDLFRSLHNNGGIRGSGAITWDLGSTNGRYYINSTSETDNAGKGSNDAVIQVAFDATSRKVWFGVNNTWQGSGNPAAGSNQIGVVAQTGPLIFFMRPESYQSAINTQTANFGQKTFAYTPPSGFSALSTANLPDPAIPLPSAQFNTLLYTGNDADGRTISGVGFQPDWVWQKARNAANYHWLFDAVRGATKFLSSNEAGSEYTQADSLSAFTSDGFTVSDNTSGADMNSSSHTYVTWNWKANGAGSTDTSGDIDGVLSANPTAGFSIVTFTGNNSANGTIPHGLGVVPDFVWYKSRVGSSWENWIHSSIISGNKRLLLQSTAAASSINTNYLLSGEIATSTMISNNAHTTSQPVVAYCFASKPGFSKVGVYTGNGSATDGPFINCGFRPAFFLLKRTTDTGDHDWFIVDNKRDPFNVVDLIISPNLAQAESTATSLVDFVSNGVKVMNSAPSINGNGATFLYMAFAESPFKTSNAH